MQRKMNATDSALTAALFEKAVQAPTRRMDRNEKALMRTSHWDTKINYEGSNNSISLQLEDKVSLAHANAAFLQGVVVYVGTVHFAKGIWVGIQLTGPSIGKGDCNGTCQGKRYFADVGRDNGILAPIEKVNKRLPTKTGDPELDKVQEKRQSEESRLADLEFIDALTQTRALAMLKLNEEKKNRGITNKIATICNISLAQEEAYISRLKQQRLSQVMASRGEQGAHLSSRITTKPNLKYAPRDSPLQACDLELAEGLELTQQNFCLSDPCLPDNPITFASQAFLNMTGYALNEILGRNCRFLQGPGTDQQAVYQLRLCIAEGSDCHICLLNYRKDGTPFYNRLFMTALRDTKGRVKNFLGVQCEVSEKVAKQINAESAATLQHKLNMAKEISTKSMMPDTSNTGSSTRKNTSTSSDRDLMGKNSSNRRKSNRRRSNNRIKNDDHDGVKPRRRRSAPNLSDLANSPSIEDIEEVQDLSLNDDKDYYNCESMKPRRYSNNTASTTRSSVSSSPGRNTGSDNSARDYGNVDGDWGTAEILTEDDFLTLYS